MSNICIIGIIYNIGKWWLPQHIKMKIIYISHIMRRDTPGGIIFRSCAYFSIMLIIKVG